MNEGKVLVFSVVFVLFSTVHALFIVSMISLEAIVTKRFNAISMKGVQHVLSCQRMAVWVRMDIESSFGGVISKHA